MIKKGSKRGTMIHGCAASEHIDSSGERIKIEGVDISRLTDEGVFNFEHQSKEASSIVGKILEAKKILKRSDCESDNHRYFWDKIKMPYIYVAGELFDEEGHQAAKDIAAMLRYDRKIDRRKTRRLINFSVEGSRLDKEGANITKCIARKVSITIMPCNKVCEAEEMKSTDTKKSLLQDVLGKNEESYCEIMKTEPRKYFKELAGPKKPSSTADYTPQSKMSVGKENMRPGKTIKPKRTFEPGQAPDKTMSGDRMMHRPKKPKTGADIYNDPDTFKEENKDMKKARRNLNEGKKIPRQKSIKQRSKVRPGKGTPVGRGKRLDPRFYDSNVKKALVAGSAMSTPSAKEGMSALSGEDIKVRMQKVCKSISDENWKTFQKSEQLINFLEQRLPNLGKKEIMALAKTVAYVHEKKKEVKLAKMIKEDLEKGSVYEKVKNKIKEVANKRDWKRKEKRTRKELIHNPIKESDKKSKKENRKRDKEAKRKLKDPDHKTTMEYQEPNFDEHGNRPGRKIPSNKDLKYPSKIAASEKMAKGVSKSKYKDPNRGLRDTSGGVHNPIASRSKYGGGKSLAGAKARRGNISGSKELHRQNLEQQKRSEKPNLPKSECIEKAKVDIGLSPKEKKEARKERGKAPYIKEKTPGDRARRSLIEEPKAREESVKRLKNKPKTSSKKDLEYPKIAASEKGV